MQIGLLRWVLGVAVATFFVPTSFVQAQAKIQSGPQPGELLPSSFAPFVVNGPQGLAKTPDGKDDPEQKLVPPGRYRSLLCDFGLRPVVMIFTRSDPAQNPPDPQLVALVTKLKARLKEDAEKVGSLRIAIIFLSPHSQSAVMEQQAASNKTTSELKRSLDDIDDKLQGIKKLPEDEQKEKLDKVKTVLEDSAKKIENLWTQRKKLRASLLQNWVAGRGLKDIRVAHFPSTGPEGYKINDKAKHTVLLYLKQRVYGNFVYPTDADMDAAQITAIMQKLEEKITQKNTIEPGAGKKK